MSSQMSSTRQRILDTALDIIATQGMKALTQPRIAKLAGIRQSHLTYYFPRKADLYLALLGASHERAERNSDKNTASLEAKLASLFFERERIRFFMSILLEVGDDPDLLAVMHEHTLGLVADIASSIGRSRDDSQVMSFIDELRGFSLRVLTSPGLAGDGREHVREIARKHRLSL